MTSEWGTIRAADFIDFNPRLSLKKGDIATKVAMDKLKPFTKKIPETEKAEFNGGAKFCNGDTVMARITPCLENGKTAYVDMLDDGEIGFGSTEFIVMRAKAGISDPQFVYYTAINPVFRNIAQSKHLQIVFTTHSVEMLKLNRYVRVQYIANIDPGGKTFVYEKIGSDLLYSLTGKTCRPIKIS